MAAWACMGTLPVGLGWRRLACCGVIWLAGCAAPTPSPPPPSAVPPAPVAPAEDQDSIAFAQRQTELADRAEADGRWADAELAWEVASLMRPADDSARQRLAAVRQRIAGIVAERRAEAESAQRRGDLDAAAQAWLELLAVSPTQPLAADALRQLERERERRRMAARNARLGFARRPADEGEPGEVTEAARRNSGLREHASLLVRQGDHDGAIALLREPARSDPALRATLADVYVAKAEALKQRDPDAARTAVDAALAIDRRHPGALALSRQLPRPPARAQPPARAASR